MKEKRPRETTVTTMFPGGQRFDCGRVEGCGVGNQERLGRRPGLVVTFPVPALMVVTALQLETLRHSHRL